MKYEIMSAVATTSTCAFSLAYAVICNRKYNAFCAWPKWDRGQGYSEEYREFLRLHGVESFIWLGVLLSFCVNFVLANIVSGFSFGGTNAAAVVGYSAFISFIALNATFYIATWRKCTL